MSSRATQKVAMLMGGLSAEREVSLVSGRECAAALRGEGFEVIELDAGADLAQRLEDLRPDVAFNALHGRWGEDGAVQGLLEWLKIPYTHSGVLASALGMDKQRSKKTFVEAGLPVVDSKIVAKSDAASRFLLPAPYVIKPNNEGSSVGIYFVQEGASVLPDLGDDLPDIVIIERFVPGRDLTTTVLDDQALAVTDIITEKWYDYAAKYLPGGSRHVVPADVPAEITTACLDYALRAHQALGCRGLSRTDFRWDETKGLEGLILLETNTQPGMTPTSLSPEQAASVGIGFGALCRRIVEDAGCDR
ncbi:D-alanine--D-alanine ligase [Rhodobacteraceae bacterium IMCC15231]|nr:D-alanine--D-alanine ligase [Rhodobacteraceae bacterium IMCC15231]